MKRRTSYVVDAPFKAPRTMYINAPRGRATYNQRMVRANPRRETGYVDLATANYNGDTTGSVVLIATIGQGASVNQRIGKKAMIKSVQMRGYGASLATTLTAKGAVMLVWDSRPTGAIPAITDILVSANAQSFTNDVNSSRFKILRRIPFSFTGNGATPGQQTSDSSFIIDDYLKINRPTTFGAAGTGAIGDIEQGAMYLVTVGDNPPGTGACFFALGFRTRFLDI